MLLEKVENIRKEIIYQANFVKSMVKLSYEGLFEKDNSKLNKVLEMENLVNKRELEIEDSSTAVIALYNPEAKLLRTILMALKINNDLERIGDLAVNISKNAAYLIQKEQIKKYIDLPQMANEVFKMLNDTIEAFVDEKVEMSKDICIRDDIIDDFKDQIYRILITYMIDEPSTIKRAIHLINIAQCLERIADLTTNIAESNIYIYKGKIIKHHFEDI